MRNLSGTDEFLKRTCPIADCGHLFHSADEMQKHVLGCLQTSNGNYRCYMCGNEEKIGRYHVNECRDVENHGGRLATTVNRLRSVKRRLSPWPQASKQEGGREPGYGHNFMSETSETLKHQGVSELPNSISVKMSGVGHIPEMPTQDATRRQNESAPVELQSNSVPTKSIGEMDGEQTSDRQQLFCQYREKSASHTFNNQWPSTYSTHDPTSPWSPVSPTDN